MGTTCPRRLEVTISITAEPEGEPAPEAPQAGEGPAAAGDDSDDGWEPIPIGAAPAGGPGRVVASSSYVRQRIPRQVGAIVEPRPEPARLLPSERRPSLADLRRPQYRFYVVWHVPGQQGLRGVHYGAGTVVWAQLQAWARLALPDSTPREVFTALRFHRCISCDFQQLEQALFRESGSEAEYGFWFWQR